MLGTGNDSLAPSDGERVAKPGEGLSITGGQAVGTRGNLAPEQKTNPQRVDSRADIYSLGVVFYEMLTGELPGKQLQPPSKKAASLVAYVSNALAAVLCGIFLPESAWSQRHTARRSKAPEGWRTPRRFAKFGSPRSTRQRLGVRAALRRFPMNARGVAANQRKPRPARKRC